jgi:hypothetical protein
MSNPRRSQADSLPLVALHAHLSTLDPGEQLCAYRRLADYANDRLLTAALRVVLGLLPTAVQLTWRRATRCDHPPVTDLLLEGDSFAPLLIPLHEELESLDVEVPSRFFHLLPDQPEQLGDELEHTLIEELARHANLSIPDYEALLFAANTIVEGNPMLERVPIRE